jgi:hypothetical protein
MRVGDLDVDVDRTIVTVRDAGGVVWEQLETAIANDETEALASANATANDDDGVDVTLIDWMLSLTPTERLRVLMRHASELAGFVRDDVRE